MFRISLVVLVGERFDGGLVGLQLELRQLEDGVVARPRVELLLQAAPLGLLGGALQRTQERLEQVQRQVENVGLLEAGVVLIEGNKTLFLSILVSYLSALILRRTT